MDFLIQELRYAYEVYAVVWWIAAPVLAAAVSGVVYYWLINPFCKRFVKRKNRKL